MHALRCAPRTGRGNAVGTGSLRPVLFQPRGPPCWYASGGSPRRKGRPPRARHRREVVGGRAGVALRGPIRSPFLPEGWTPIWALVLVYLATAAVYMGGWRTNPWRMHIASRRQGRGADCVRPPPACQDTTDGGMVTRPKGPGEHVGHAVPVGSSRFLIGSSFSRGEVGSLPDHRIARYIHQPTHDRLRCQRRVLCCAVLCYVGSRVPPGSRLRTWQQSARLAPAAGPLPRSRDSRKNLAFRSSRHPHRLADQSLDIRQQTVLVL